MLKKFSSKRFGEGVGKEFQQSSFSKLYLPTLKHSMIMCYSYDSYIYDSDMVIIIIIIIWIFIEVFLKSKIYTYRPPTIY